MRGVAKATFLFIFNAKMGGGRKVWHGTSRRFYATASLFTPRYDECFPGLAHPESDADRPVMPGNDADDFRIKPERSRPQRTRGRSHDLPFLQQVKAAVRKAGGNPNRIGRGSGSAGSRKGEGGGRFNAHGRGAKVVASFPKDGGGWSRDGSGTRFRPRRMVVKARVVKLNPQRGSRGPKMRGAASKAFPSDMRGAQVSLDYFLRYPDLVRAAVIRANALQALLPHMQKLRPAAASVVHVTMEETS